MSLDRLGPRSASTFPVHFGTVDPLAEEERHAARRTLAGIAARVGAPPADLHRTLEALGLVEPSPDPPGTGGASSRRGGPARVGGGRGPTLSKRHKATQPRPTSRRRTDG